MAVDKTIFDKRVQTYEQAVGLYQSIDDPKPFPNRRDTNLAFLYNFQDKINGNPIEDLSDDQLAAICKKYYKQLEKIKDYEEGIKFATSTQFAELLKTKGKGAELKITADLVRDLFKNQVVLEYELIYNTEKGKQTSTYRYDRPAKPYENTIEDIITSIQNSTSGKPYKTIIEKKPI